MAHPILTKIMKYVKHFITKIGLGSESLRTHLSTCVLFRYNNVLNIVVRGDSEPIPKNTIQF